MIRDTDTKRYLFVVPRLPDEDEANKIITTVKEHATTLKDRTHLKFHETFSPHVTISYPIKRVAHLDGIIAKWICNVRPEPPLDKSSFAKITPKLIDEARKKVTSWGQIRWWINFKESVPGRDLELVIDIEGPSVSLELSSDSLREQSFENQLDWVSSTISVGKLPLKVSDTRQPDDDLLQHLGKGKAKWHFPALHKNPSVGCYFTCELENISTGDLFQMVNRFRSHAEVADVFFEFELRKLRDLDIRCDEVVKELNRLKLPFKQVSVMYFWGLEDYSKFAAAELMAEEREGLASQSLFEFKFGKGYKGQLDMAAFHGFKFWFSFDNPMASSEFTKLTRIKLKPTNWNT